jgi:hypothetical protein
MPQDHQSGIDGNEFGRTMAPKIAHAVGATMHRKGSNEAVLGEKRIVIKCARKSTRSIGVSYRMLPTLSAIVAAFQRDDGAFDVFSLDAQTYKKHMKETRSKGASAGRVGIVTKSAFTTEGESIGTVSIDESKDGS